MGIVVELENKRGKKPTFDVLTAIVAEDMALVNQLILKRMESPVAQFHNWPDTSFPLVANVFVQC